MIFGNPVLHSISPLMHNYAIKGLGLEACYGRYLLEDGSKLKETFFKLGILGANVTIPHKEIAFKICDEVRGIAKDIGSVNTIVKKKDKLIGYNSDAPGFYHSIKEFNSVSSVLILGAGGTAKAIANILNKNNIDVSIINRSDGRLDYFRDRGFKTYNFEDVFESGCYDLVINTTSAGLVEDILPLPKEILEVVFKGSRYAVDVIYKKETAFLREAKRHGLHTKDGSDMLLYQGIISFNYFFDNRFESDDIARYMKKAFL